MVLYFQSIFLLLWVFIQIVSAWLLADFLSGVLHWFQDRYCQRYWPVIGDIIVEPNDIHHVTPRSFTTDGFFLRNWASFVVAFVAGFLFYGTGTLNWFTGGFVAASSFLPTQAHYWAHRSETENGPLISTLQRLGVIQSSQHHWRHHRGSKDKYFCTMTDFVNPVLERIQFFQRVEKVIKFVTGVRPKIDITDLIEQPLAR